MYQNKNSQHREITETSNLFIELLKNQVIWKLGSTQHAPSNNMAVSITVANSPSSKKTWVEIKPKFWKKQFT